MIVKNYFLPRGLKIDIEISGSVFGLKNTIKIKGEISHCNYIKFHTYKCGIKFLELSKKNRKLIADFVASKKKKTKK